MFGVQPLPGERLICMRVNNIYIVYIRPGFEDSISRSGRLRFRFGLKGVSDRGVRTGVGDDFFS